MGTEDIAYEEYEDRSAEAEALAAINLVMDQAMHDDPARERAWRDEVDAYLDALEASEAPVDDEEWEDADTGLTSRPYTRMVWGEEADRIDDALPY